MLIKNIKVSGLLSFGAKGINLSMKNLTVLIGPNGSGKSNLLEVLALLKAAPRNLHRERIIAALPIPLLTSSK